MNERERDRLLEAIRQRTGICYRRDQLASIERTLTGLMDRLNLDSPDELIAAVEHRREVYHELINEITVGETYFFREPKHFEFIRHTVIPELRRRRGEQTTLRAWSAACASGEEAYSLAILCDQMSQPVDLIGTDLSPDSIAQARRGLYREWSFRGGTMASMRNYFAERDSPQQPKRYALCEPIKSRVRFRVLNLVAPSYPDPQTGLSEFDLILCRIVVIYFYR
ncbi:MAG: CheR family methyltransferase, partial [Novipirellula sp. JB048]